jgi:hypothetical protein
MEEELGNAQDARSIFESKSFFSHSFEVRVICEV